MKYGKTLAVVLLMLVCFTGCAEKSSRLPNTNSNVDKVIEEQINSTDQAAAGSSSGGQEVITNTQGESSLQGNGDKTKKQTAIHTQDGLELKENSEGDVDYDLTVMTSDMVYATIYQLVNNPDDYIGKTFRVKGNYYASYYQPTEKYYHYVIIQDAVACCAQGLEFIWGDGSHKYPDEYPEEQTEVIVEGTFETYREEGERYLYCRLEDAVLQ